MLKLSRKKSALAVALITMSFVGLSIVSAFSFPVCDKGSVCVDMSSSTHPQTTTLKFKLASLTPGAINGTAIIKIDSLGNGDIHLVVNDGLSGNKHYIIYLEVNNPPTAISTGSDTLTIIGTMLSDKNGHGDFQGNFLITLNEGTSIGPRIYAGTLPIATSLPLFGQVIFK